MDVFSAKGLANDQALAASLNGLPSQQRMKVQRGLARLCRKLSQCSGLEDIAHVMLPQLGRLIRLRCASLAVYERDHRLLLIKASWRGHSISIERQPAAEGRKLPLRRRALWTDKDGVTHIPAYDTHGVHGHLSLEPVRPLEDWHLSVLSWMVGPLASALCRGLLIRDRDWQATLAVLAADTTSEGIWLTDRNGVTEMTNRRIAEILGYSSQELVGRKIFDFVDPQVRDVLRARWEQRLAAGRVELPMLHKDGSKRWVSTAPRAVPPPEAGERRILVMVNDLTAQRTAEIELARSEAKYRWLVETCTNMIWIIDRTGRYRFINPAVESIMGYRPEEVVGRYPGEFQSEEQFERDQDVVRLALAGEHVTYESVFLHRTGRPVILLINCGALRDETGEMVGVIGTATDVTDYKTTEDVLRQRETQLRLVLEQLPAIVWTTEDRLRVQSVIGAGLPLLGLKADQLIGRTIGEIFGWGDVLTHMSSQALVGNSVSREGRRDERVLQTMVEPLRNERGSIVGTLGISFDITDLRRSQEDLAEERERAQATLDSIGDGVVTIDVAGRITYMNPVALSLCGRNKADVIGQCLAKVVEVVEPDTGRVVASPATLVLQEGQAVAPRTTRCLRRSSGELVAIEERAAPIRDRSGHLTGAVLVFHDVSAAQEMAAQLSYQATHDALTGLPNRTLLLDRLAQSLIQAGRHGGRVALIFIDVDRFKQINDTLGHAVGDQLLQQISQRLTQCVRRSDTVSRHGGDEFIILLPEAGEPMELSDLAEKILLRMSEPYLVGEHELHLSGSIGVSMFPDDGADAETLIKHADIAMYHAKQNGRNTFQFFIDDMNRKATERLFLEHSLRRALDRNELVLRYQPQINLRSGRIVGAEALLRWRHPKRGLIPPTDFVPIAEDSGIILSIGRWVLEEACRQARQWQEQGLPAVRIAVNLSTVELRQKVIVQDVERILAASGLQPDLLDLELTESVVMSEIPGAARRLWELKELGLRLSIDDFGTGYSSLSYLKRLPVDSLKIDKAFIHDVAGSEDDAAIADAIIRMGHSLRLSIIAEGVENRSALNFLQARDCDDVQGYFFSRPLDAERFVEMMQRHQPERPQYHSQ